MKEYVIKTETGLYVGIDNASGGYPFETEYLGSSHIWKSKQAAEDYMSNFPKETWELYEITTNKIL